MEKPSQKVKQLGLYAITNKEAEDFVKRVSDFNKNHLTTPVTLDIIPVEEGDKECPDPHFKLNLLFPSHAVQTNFWTV